MEENKNDVLEAIKDKYAEDFVANNYEAVVNEFVEFIEENGCKQQGDDEEDE